MHGYPLPPVPKRLEELLAAYPDLIARLQEALNRSAEDSRRIPLVPFEYAVWAIEDCFDSIYSDAEHDVRIAEETGDSQLIAAAKDKRLLIGRSRNKWNWIGDEDVYAYFSTGFR